MKKGQGKVTREFRELQEEFIRLVFGPESVKRPVKKKRGKEVIRDDGANEKDS